MLNLLKRLVSPLQEFGPTGVVYLVDRGLRRAHPELGLVLYDFMAQPITAKPLLPSGLSRYLSYRELLADSDEVANMPAHAEIKTKRFEQGALPLGVFRKDDLIGYVWFSSRRYIEDEVRCVYVLQHDSSVFDFDLVVLPSARMGLGFGALWQCANQYLIGRGITTSYSRVSRFNVASLRAHMRLGARRIGSALFVKAWGLEIMLATIKPYFSVSTASQEGPTITLNAGG